MSVIRNKFMDSIKLFFKQTASLGKDKVTYVGADHLGNKYYQAEKPNSSRRIQRYFERKGYDHKTNVIDLAEVPPAWDAWLRFRRKEPPSEEELRESEEYFKNQQAMAAERKSKHQGESHDSTTTESQGRGGKTLGRRDLPKSDS